MKPLNLYRTVADVEAVTWALLILGMILKYTGVTEVGVSVAGPVHGLAFLVFLVSTTLVWANNRWTPARGVLGLASSVIPFATVPFERSAHHAGKLDGGWRTDNPVLAVLVGRPREAAGVLAGVILVVFVVLMFVGGPFSQK